MIERPTRQQVDRALVEHDAGVIAGDDTDAPCCILVAEVRALREEIKLAHGEFAALTIYGELLKKRLATVEALPGKWRADVFGRDSAVDSPWELALGDCAGELERALRGETVSDYEVPDKILTAMMLLRQQVGYLRLILDPVSQLSDLDLLRLDTWLYEHRCALEMLWQAVHQEQSTRARGRDT